MPPGENEIPLLGSAVAANPCANHCNCVSVVCCGNEIRPRETAELMMALTAVTCAAGLAEPLEFVAGMASATADIEPITITAVWLDWMMRSDATPNASYCVWLIPVGRLTIFVEMALSTKHFAAML